MVKFLDLSLQRNAIKEQLEASIADIIQRGQFINGPEVKAFENELKEYCGVEKVVSCANGTDALTLALMSFDIEVGSAVIVPSFTYVASAEAVAQLGLVPYFVDVDSLSFNISCGASG